jgi:hypothetical protein
MTENVDLIDVAIVVVILGSMFAGSLAHRIALDSREKLFYRNVERSRRERAERECR